MNQEITESISYEKGYLKGFHDGRKWHELEEDKDQEIKLIELWSKFCKENINQNLSCTEQWQQIKLSLEVFANNNIELKSCWKTFSANAVQHIASNIKSGETNLIDAMELLHDLRNFLRVIYKNT
jgi:hypothetical protein